VYTELQAFVWCYSTECGFCGYKFSQNLQRACSNNYDHTPYYLRSRMTTIREFSMHFIMETMETRRRWAKNCHNTWTKQFCKILMFNLFIILSVFWQYLSFARQVPSVPTRMVTDRQTQWVLEPHPLMGGARLIMELELLC